MNENSIPATEVSKISVVCSGSLALRGAKDDQVKILGEQSAMVRVRREGDVVLVKSSGDLELQVPESVALLVEKVGGDCYLYQTECAVEISKVGGSLRLEDVTVVKVDKIGGDLRALNVREGLAVMKVGGSFEGKEIAAILDQMRVGGDAWVDGLKGGVFLQAGGDLAMNHFAPGAETARLTAGGDIMLGLTELPNAKVAIKADGEDISVNMPGWTLHCYQRHYATSVGNGEGALDLNAGSDVRIGDTTAGREWVEALDDRFGEDWEDVFDRDMVTFNWDLNNLGEQITSQIESQVQMGMSRAQRQLEAAMRRLERKGGRGFVVGMNVVKPVEPVTPPSAPDAPAAPRGNVSEEEQLMVLRMVQENKITVEEAEQLLAALDGKQG